MKQLTVACLILALAVCAAVRIAAQPLTGTVAADFRQQFERRLEAAASKVDGVVGYAIVDLTSGDRFVRHDRDQFPTASTIKLAILYDLFKQVDAGTAKLDEPIPLDRRQAVGGSGVLFDLGTPTLSLVDYATLMIILSDNTATNVVIDRLGMRHVNETAQALGLSSTKLRRHMMDTAAARRGDENVSSPADLAALLGLLRDGKLLAAGSRDQALKILEKPKTTRIRRGVPPGIVVADKTGELDGVRADAGIVFAKDRPYIIVVMTTYLQDETAGEDAIVEMSRAAYEHFSRLAAGGVYGRAIRN